MKTFAILLLQTVALTSYAYAQRTHNIIANINGIQNDTIYVIYTSLNNDTKHVDTVYAKNNFFTYNLPIDDIVDMAIVPKSSFHRFKSGRLYIPNTKFINLVIQPTDSISIIGTLSQEYLSFSTNGSVINWTLDSLRRIYKPLDIAAVKYELELGSLAEDTSQEKLSKTLFNKRAATAQQIGKLKLDFITHNLDKEVAAFLLLKQPFEVFAKYCPLLSKKVKNGIFTQALEKKILQYKRFMETNNASHKIREGTIAPDFCLQDLNGKEFCLSKLKRKYIVIDFWGSWCGWCIKEFPKMKEFYNKYKSTVAFIGIACNDEKADWQKAVSKYQIDWTQVIDSKEQDVATFYGIKVCPTKIILNQDYKIIKIFTGAGDAFFQELDKLME